MSQPKLLTDLSVKADVNLYYDLFIPENAVRPAPLLIAVHGYGAHKRYMMREAQAIAPEGMVIASVQGPHQHFRPTDTGYKIGFGWLTEYKSDDSIAVHRTFLLNVINRLVKDGIADPESIFLYGFSQACALNFRFAFTCPGVLKGLIGVCGGIPGDLGTNDFYRPTKADVLYLYASDDEWYPLGKFREYEEKLRNYLPNFESKEYQAKHEITEEMREEMRMWLKEKTEAPSGASV